MPLKMSSIRSHPHPNWISINQLLNWSTPSHLLCMNLPRVKQHTIIKSLCARRWLREDRLSNRPSTVIDLCYQLEFVMVPSWQKTMQTTNMDQYTIQYTTALLRTCMCTTVTQFTGSRSLQLLQRTVSRQGQMMSCCEHGNKPPSFFTNQHMKKGTEPHSQLLTKFTGEKPHKFQKFVTIYKIMTWTWL